MVELHFLFLYIFITLITKIKNECNKDIPIQTINGCEDIYCTEIQFKSGECTISNSIVKKQWLNDIVTFGESDTWTFGVVQMLNKDIIFIGSYYNDDECYYPFLYGLKSSGEIFFNDKFDYKDYDYYYILNGVGLKIENKYYPLVCDRVKCSIFDLEKKKLEEKRYSELIEYTIFPNTDFIILNLDNNYKILFTLLNRELYLSIINIKSNDFSSFETINQANGQDIIHITDDYRQLYVFKCFITNKKFIECLYAHDNKYLVAVYDESLNYLTSIFLHNFEILNSIKNPVNAIHLKNEIGVFTYYININFFFIILYN